MDYMLDLWLGRWQIVAVDPVGAVGYEERVVAEFQDETLARQNWDLVMTAEGIGA